MLTLYQKIACIVGFSAIFLVVSSNILVNYEQIFQAKPGKNKPALDGRAVYMATQLDQFGFLNIEIDNGNPHTLFTGSFFDNTGSEISNYFTIIKQIQAKDANILPNSGTE